MALSPNPPPQAYTRDTLVKAIEWMATQPASVRERAHSADLIVSHFLAARRRMPFAGEMPGTDFRAIAESLKALDTPELPNFEAATPEPEPAPLAPAPLPPKATRRRETQRAQAPAPLPESPRYEVGPARGEPDLESTVAGLRWTVDDRSRSIAREVQDRMNLSSESEALRMLVAMGAERLRGVLP